MCGLSERGIQWQERNIHLNAGPLGRGRKEQGWQRSVLSSTKALAVGRLFAERRTQIGYGLLGSLPFGNELVKLSSSLVVEPIKRVRFLVVRLVECDECLLQLDQRGILTDLKFLQTNKKQKKKTQTKTKNKKLWAGVVVYREFHQPCRS